MLPNTYKMITFINPVPEKYYDKIPSQEEKLSPISTVTASTTMIIVILLQNKTLVRYKNSAQNR